MNADLLKNIIEAALLAAEQPLNLNQLSALFDEGQAPAHADLSQALEALSNDCENRGIELSKVASGYRLQVKTDMQPWISRLWAEKPPRYSRALLETLAIIAYRQPMTRAEIEQIRGVAVSSNIMRTLQEREWVRIVGHRDVPGRPALVGTTKRFLDYFDLASLDELPSLAELKDLGELEPELELEIATAAASAEKTQDTGEDGEQASSSDDGGEPLDEERRDEEGLDQQDPDPESPDPESPDQEGPDQEGPNQEGPNQENSGDDEQSVAENAEPLAEDHSEQPGEHLQNGNSEDSSPSDDDDTPET